MASASDIGSLLRAWRQRRRQSQLSLACEAEISARHLSFIETGRSLPSREMVLRLAEHLEVPLRNRNQLLLAAGYAPQFRETSIDEPDLHSARQAIDVVLAGHEPNPALAFDKHWKLVASNKATTRLLVGVDPELLRPPANVLRLALHPAGLAPRILNLQEWRTYVFRRLRHQISISDDPVLKNLLEELSIYPGSFKTVGPLPENQRYTGVVVRFQLVVDGTPLSFFTTTTIFGTPLDITLSELAIESYFPADDQTADALKRLACSMQPEGSLSSSREL